MKTKSSKSKKRDTEKLIADLVWDYCEKMRRGESVVFEDYQAKCPGAAAKRKFEIAVAMSGLIDLATEHEIRMINADGPQRDSRAKKSSNAASTAEAETPDEPLIEKRPRVNRGL